MKYIIFNYDIISKTVTFITEKIIIYNKYNECFTHNEALKSFNLLNIIGNDNNYEFIIGTQAIAALPILNTYQAIIKMNWNSTSLSLNS